MRKTRRSIDKYLRELPDDVRDDMAALHGALAPVFAGLSQALFVGKFWGGSDQEIIGYGAANYTRPNGTSVEWFMVGLAAQKNYLSVYINAVEDRQYLSEKYGHELGKVKVGKASLGFKRLDDIDLDKLVALAQRARTILEADS